MTAGRDDEQTNFALKPCPTEHQASRGSVTHRMHPHATVIYIYIYYSVPWIRRHTYGEEEKRAAAGSSSGILECSLYHEPLLQLQLVRAYVESPVAVRNEKALVM